MFPIECYAEMFFSSKSLNLSEVAKCLKCSQLKTPCWNISFPRMGMENWIMKSLEKCCWNLMWFHCDIYFIYDMYHIIKHRKNCECCTGHYLSTCVYHTSYLSREPQVYSCKFFLAGVNFYRFNAKNWHFTV